MAAILALLNGETGTIINEHYSLNEYINRRGGFLGRHPDYARMPTGLFAVARRDAADVFQQDRELSVQEVRRREFKLDVTPLLPLPTTNNCESLDNFRSYPDREWTPGYMPSVDRIDDMDIDEDNDHSLGLMQPWDATAPYETVAPSTQAMNNMKPETRLSQQAVPSGSSRCFASSQTMRAPQHDKDVPVSSIEDGQDLMSRAANSQQTTQVSQQSTARTNAARFDYNRNSGPIMTTPNTLRRAPTSTAASEPATAMKDASIETISTPATSIYHDAAKAGHKTPERGRSLISSKHSRSSQASALAGRGISIPVKTKPGVKRARSESPAAVDSVIGDSPQPGPPKRLKLHAGPPPTADAPDDTVPVVEQAPTARSKRKTAQLATSHDDGKPDRHPRAESGDAPNSTTAEIVHQDNAHIEAVAAGTALPKTKKEAEAASKLRYDRLLARHQTAVLRQAKKNKKNAQTALKNHAHPDLMPEFFDVRNFPQDEKDSTVRCVCMVVHDDGTKMISCGDCLVWQHPGCMGEGVPKNQKRGKYGCHVCDPWRHRQKLAELRKAHSTMA